MCAGEADAPPHSGLGDDEVRHERAVVRMDAAAIGIPHVWMARRLTAEEYATLYSQVALDGGAVGYHPDRPSARRFCRTMSHRIVARGQDESSRAGDQRRYSRHIPP